MSSKKESKEISMKDFLDSINHDESINIAIDFDGVIHDNCEGWKDGTVYGLPIDGMQDAIENLSKKFNVIVFTAKAKSDRPLINGKSGVDLIEEWLDKYGILKFVSEITSEKPRAVAYIDDKGIRFNNWKDCFIELENRGII